MRIKSTLYAALVTVLFLFAACSKSPSPTGLTDYWKIGNATYGVNGDNLGIADSIIFSSNTARYNAQLNCGITVMPGKLPYTNTNYTIVAAGTAGLSLYVSDSSGHTYITHNTNQTAAIQAASQPGINSGPKIINISIPAIWLYNQNTPSDSIQFSANLNDKLGQ